MLVLLGGVSLAGVAGQEARAERRAPVFGELINSQTRDFQQGTVVQGDLYQKDGQIRLDGVSVAGTLHLDGGQAVFGRQGAGYGGTSVQSLAGAGTGELASPKADHMPQWPSPKVDAPFQGELMITNGQGRDFSGSLSGNGDLTLASGRQGLTGVNPVSGVVSVRNGTLLLHDGGAIVEAPNGATGTVNIGLSYPDSGHVVMDGPHALIRNQMLSIGNGDKSYGTGSVRGHSDLTLENGARILDAGPVIAVGNGQDGVMTLKSGSMMNAANVFVGADVASRGTLNIEGAGTQADIDRFFIGAPGKGEVAVSDNALLKAGTRLQFGSPLRDNGASTAGTLAVRDNATFQAGDVQGNIPAIVGLPGVGAAITLSNATVRNLLDHNMTSEVGATLSEMNHFDVQGQGQVISWKGGLSGTGGFVKTGDGKLLLNGKTRYDGAVDIRGGTLHLAGSRIDGVITNNGGTLQAEKARLGDVVQNAGKEQAPSMLASSNVGSVTVNNGVLNLEKGTVRGNLNVQGGALYMNGATVNGWMNANSGSFRVGRDGGFADRYHGTIDGYFEGDLMVSRKFGSYANSGRILGPGHIRFRTGEDVLSRMGDEGMPDAGLSWREGGEHDGDEYAVKDEIWPGLVELNNGALVDTRDGRGNMVTFEVGTGETIYMNGLYPNTPFYIQLGTTLAGIGIVKALHIDSTSTAAPGDVRETGTLHVLEDFSMEKGSVLRIRGTSEEKGGFIKANRLSYVALKSDALEIGGKATLNGGIVKLDVQNPATLTYDHAYRILVAAGGVSGHYDELTTNLGSQYAYLDPRLVYGSNDVDIVMARSTRSFATAGTTRNEITTGRGLDRMDQTGLLGQAVVGLSRQQARQALDNLSGELHASIRTALIQDSFYIRNAVLNRLASSDCSGGRNGQGVYDLKTHRKNGACSSEHAVLWGQAYGGLGHNGGDGNAALMHHNTAGFVMGMDTPVRGSHWRVGGLLSYGHSMFDIGGGRSSSANSSNITIGGYAGTHWGRLNLRLGAAYGWNVINTRRQIAVGGYGGRVSSGYLGGTAQGFAELGYRLGSQRSVFEPFMNVAYVNMQNSSYREHGNEAALRSRGTDGGVTFSTFGFRASTRFNVGKLVFMPHFTGAYRHAFGRLGSRQHEMFASGTGGNGGMDVGGVLLSSSAAVIDTGLTARLTDRLDLDLSYIGQYGNQSTESGASGSVHYRF